MMSQLVHPFRPWKHPRLTAGWDTGAGTVRNPVVALARALGRARHRRTLADVASELAAGADDRELARLNRALSPSLDDARFNAQRHLSGGLSWVV